MERVPVRLAVYDLSNGLAAQLAPLLLGKQLEAIYHSAVLLRGEEIYFGAGISRVRDGASRFGSARLRVLDLGETAKSRDEVDGFLRRAAASSFSPTKYDLLARNCNHFSDEFATFLTGRANCVPREIVNLPQEVLNSPFGEALRPMLAGLEASLAVREGGEGEEGGEAVSTTTTTLPTPAAALEAAAGRAAVADAEGREARHAAPATAALPTLGEQERAVAADVAASASAAAAKPAAAPAAPASAPAAAPSAEKLRAEFEALVRAEFDAVRSASPALSANEAAAVALERAAAAVRGKA